MPSIKSTSYPDRASRDFNEWQQDLLWERDLERLLEDFKRSIGEKVRAAYYDRKK
jgi:hypothetical protein